MLKVKGLGLKPTESYHLTLRFSPAPQSIFEISIFKLPFSKWSRWPQSLSGAGPPITGGNTPGDELQLDFNLIFFFLYVFMKIPVSNKSWQLYCRVSDGVSQRSTRLTRGYRRINIDLWQAGWLGIEEVSLLAADCSGWSADEQRIIQQRRGGKRREMWGIVRGDRGVGFHINCRLCRSDPSRRISCSVSERQIPRGVFGSSVMKA